MARPISRSKRKRSVQWNDRLQIAALLLKCGYAAKITHQTVPGQAGRNKAQKEYVIEYWEEGSDVQG